MPIQVGDILGDYQVTGILGRGGMGKVFRVRSLLTDREEAMKVVLPDLDENPGLIDRFLREMKVHASLQHPNIAALHTALRIDNRLVMILELVEGASLEERMREGAIDVPAAVHYIAQVLRALAFAHERGVIHRDIKPANILIGADGVVKLTDFGIARPTTGARLTGTGMAIGTLAYMAPEQIRNASADARSDIYSLGITFYEMVTRRHAIRGESEHALMEAHLHDIPVEPCTLNPYLPQAISAAIMRSIEKDPNQRFQTAAEFEAALEHTGLSTPAPRTAVAPEALSELEARLSRFLGPIAKRLVPDAARRYGTLGEIRQALAAHIESSVERAMFLKTDVTATKTIAMATPAPALTPVPAAFDPAVLDRLAHALAPFIGPVAKVLVSRTARKAQNIEDLQNQLAAELQSADDRRRFLAAVR